MSKQVARCSVEPDHQRPATGRQAGGAVENKRKSTDAKHDHRQEHCEIALGAPCGEGACSRWAAQQTQKVEGRFATQREQAPSPQNLICFQSL